MSVRAYVLITVDAAKTPEVVQTLMGVPEVRAVNEVMGPYDVVVELETAEFDGVTAALREHIRPIDGVRNTLTCVIMPPSVEDRHSESG